MLVDESTDDTTRDCRERVKQECCQSVPNRRLSLGQRKLDDRRRFRTTIGQIKRLIDRGQSGPDRAEMVVLHNYVLRQSLSAHIYWTTKET